jgi:XTP/dITP diphosphohydrolase
MNIWFATNNTHKKKELETILGKKLKIPSEEGIEFNLEEAGSSFYENSLLKAKELRNILNNGDYVIADDSGLCVDALNGRPGIFSARYGSKDGKNLASEERNNLLLGELTGSANRKARFICAMTLLTGKDRFITVQETIEGEIVESALSAKGTGGFGYDPVFFIPSLGKTMAQLSGEEKNNVSHRGKAGKIIGNILCQNLI